MPRGVNWPFHPWKATEGANEVSHPLGALDVEETHFQYLIHYPRICPQAVILTGDPPCPGSGMSWSDCSLWLWSHSHCPLTSCTRLEKLSKLSCAPKLLALSQTCLCHPGMVHRPPRWLRLPCLQKGEEVTLNNLGHQGMELPCGSETAQPQKCKVRRPLEESSRPSALTLQSTWHWALCPGQKEHGEWKSRSLFDN